MSLSDILAVVAILVAPFSAVYAQRKLDIRREKGQRKVGVFKTLMATRGAVLSPEHVEALNMIDLEFREKTEEPVRAAWREYRDHLNSFPRDGESLSQRQIVWGQKTQDLLVKLLDNMGKSLGYTFDAVEITKGAYRPEAYGTAEIETQILRRTLAEWLLGDRHVSVAVVPIDAEADKKGQLLLNGIISLLDGDKRIGVDVHPDETLNQILAPDSTKRAPDSG